MTQWTDRNLQPPPVVAPINNGVQAIWEGALIRIHEGCQPEANRATVQASLDAYKAMAWGAALCSVPDASLVHRLISRAEQEYWLQSPTMRGLEAWAKNND